MSTIHGFEQIRVEHIDELNTTATLYRHLKSGAQLLSLQNDDENKVFGVTFRTPPADSTGVAHIMEHAVLGGSRKYRMKEPFVELIKGSLKTFVNAMTGLDRTMYPVASQNLQDFYNLVDVYLDAVFYPLITPNHLAQEGWHYELNNTADPLIYKGVVFNEMKGAYSSPESVMGRAQQHSLFPGHVYGRDSGGDPVAIPDLTYAQFKAFHETYYHPSNARLFFYGDDDPTERLRILDSYLRDFEAKQVQSQIPPAVPFAEPQYVVEPYSVDADADLERMGRLGIRWVLPEVQDAVTQMGLRILSYCLLGTQASPLRKILVDSGYGEDVHGGIYNGLRQPLFSVGMKGISPADAAAVEALILQTLAQLARDGFEEEMIEAAVNTFDFSLRENNTGSYPRGISLMYRVLSNWLYDEDPIAPLAFAGPLTAVKKALATDPTYLQNLIQTYILDNPHRTTVTLEPDSGLQQRQETAEKEKLAQIKASLNKAELAAIVEQTATLRKLQSTPDTPELLATLPQLTLDDLDKSPRHIPLELQEAHGSQILYHDLFTNGIVYCDIGLNLHVVPANLLPYLSLFMHALSEMGTRRRDFVKLSQLIGRKSGGIYPTRFTSAVYGRETAQSWLFLRGKGRMDQAADLLDIMREMLLEVNLDNQERFLQILLKTKSRREAGLIPGGSGVVNGRLQSRFSEAGWANEQMGGIANLLFLRTLVAEAKENWPAILQNLETIRHLLMQRGNLIANVTLDADNYAQFAPMLHQFMAEFAAGAPETAVWQPTLFPQHEGLTLPAQVNYVGKGANLYALGYQLHGSVSVITNFLRTTYLWEKIRVQGGAYGAQLSFNQHAGVFAFLSYRDPNLLKTLANYDGAGDFLRKLQIDEHELTKSIIGAIGTLDAYQLPDAKGYSSMLRHLLGIDDARRQQYRDEVLATTLADFHRFGEVLNQVNDQGTVVVLGAADALHAANEANGGWLKLTKLL